jgi:hypothetical protein
MGGGECGEFRGSVVDVKEYFDRGGWLLRKKRERKVGK